MARRSPGRPDEGRPARGDRRARNPDAVRDVAGREERARRQRKRERERRERAIWFDEPDAPTDGASAADAGAASLWQPPTPASSRPRTRPKGQGRGADVRARAAELGEVLAPRDAHVAPGTAPVPRRSRKTRREDLRRLEDPATRRAREARRAMAVRRARWGSALLGLLVVATLVWQVPRMAVFSVRQVGVEGTSAVSDLTVRAKVDPLLVDQTIYTADRDRIAAAVETLPFVRSVQVRRHFPDGLSIRIEEYSPLAFAYGGNGGFLVARDGRVLARARVADWSDRVPVVRIDRRHIDVGDNIGSAPALRILRAVPATFPGAFQRVDLGQFGYVGVLVDGPEVRFGRDDDLARKFQVTERLLGMFGANRRQGIDYIDVSVTARPAIKAS